MLLNVAPINLKALAIVQVGRDVQRFNASFQSACIVFSMHFSQQHSVVGQ
jgi:hypothetical protein